MSHDVGRCTLPHLTDMGWVGFADGSRTESPWLKSLEECATRLWAARCEANLLTEDAEDSGGDKVSLEQSVHTAARLLVVTNVAGRSTAATLHSTSSARSTCIALCGQVDIAESTATGRKPDRLFTRSTSVFWS